MTPRLSTSGEELIASQMMTMGRAFSHFSTMIRGVWRRNQSMAQGRRHSSSEIAALLKKIKRGIARGENVSLVCSQAGISEQTYYRWLAEFGELNAEQISCIQDLEKETVRRQRARLEGQRIGRTPLVLDSLAIRQDRQHGQSIRPIAKGIVFRRPPCSASCGRQPDKAFFAV